MTDLDELRRRYPPDQVLTLDVLGTALSIRTNDPRVAAGLARYFASFRSPAPLRGEPLAIYVLHGTPLYDPRRLQDVAREAPGRSIKEGFYDAPGARVVVKRRTGMVIYIAEPDHYVVGDALRNLHQAANLVSTVFAKAMLRRGYVMLHASAALGTEGGVAFAAESGAGKSTMALALVEKGYRFVTNDRLLVRPDNGRVEMVGLPRIPRVNPGTLLRLSRLARLLPREAHRRYEGLSPDALWAAEEKRDVEIDRIFGPGTFQLTGRLAIIYLLAWHAGEGGWAAHPLVPAARRGALRRMAKQIGVQDPHPPSPAAQEAALDAVAEALPICEVTGRRDVSALRDFIIGSHGPRVACL